MSDIPEKLRILVAEDNGPTRQYLAAALEIAGFEVVQAADGEEAIKAIRENPVACGVIDLVMSPKDGFDFSKMLALEGVSMPLLLITAQDLTNLLLEARENGFQHALKKPVDGKRLAQLVKRMTAER